MVYDIGEMIEITLKEPDDFLKVKETLTLIGVASRKEKTLYQSCHILHKQSKYYIVHFKELFALDGKPYNFSDTDIARISNLLEEWSLVKLVDVEKTKDPILPLNQLKILSFSEKEEWTLTPKYNIGKKS